MAKKNKQEEVVINKEAEQPVEKDGMSEVEIALAEKLRDKIKEIKEKIASFDKENLKPIREQLSNDVRLIEESLPDSSQEKQQAFERAQELNQIIDKLNEIVEQTAKKIKEAENKIEIDKAQKTKAIDETVAYLNTFLKDDITHPRQEEVEKMVTELTGALNAVNAIEFGATLIDAPIKKVVQELEDELRSIDAQERLADTIAAEIKQVEERQQYYLNEWHRTSGGDFDIDNDEHQKKMAYEAALAELPADSNLAILTDIERQKCARDDKKFNRPGEFNSDNIDDDNFDYQEGTDQYRLQSGEALRYVMEAQKRIQTIEDLSGRKNIVKNLIDQLKAHSNEELTALQLTLLDQVSVEYQESEEGDRAESVQGAGETTQAEQVAQEQEKYRSVIDFSTPMIRELLNSSRDALRGVVASVAVGDIVTAKNNADLIFNNLPDNTKQQFEARALELGYKWDDFIDQWKNKGVAEKLIEALQVKVEAKKREKAVESIGIVDKAKAMGWKSVAKKVAVVAGVAGVAGLALFGTGGLAGVGAAISLGGLINLFKKHHKKDGKSLQKLEQEQMQANNQQLIEQRQKDMHSQVAMEIMEDDAFMAELFSQSIREGSAANLGLNANEVNGHLIHQNILKELVKLYESRGDVEQAQSANLQALLESFHTRVDLVQAAEQAKKDPKMIRIVEKIVKLKSGTADIKDQEEISKWISIAAPLAIGGAVVLAGATGGVGALIARGAIGSISLGYGGYKVGEALDNKAREKQIKKELANIIDDTRASLQEYQQTGMKPPLLEENIKRLEGHLRVGSLNSDPLLKTRAEALLREAHRGVEQSLKDIADNKELSESEQAEKVANLLGEIGKQSEKAFVEAQNDLDRIFGAKKQWRKWFGAGLGVAAGAGIPFIRFLLTEAAPPPLKPAKPENLANLGEKPVPVEPKYVPPTPRNIPDRVPVLPKTGVRPAFETDNEMIIPPSGQEEISGAHKMMFFGKNLDASAWHQDEHDLLLKARQNFLSMERSAPGKGMAIDPNIAKNGTWGKLTGAFEKAVAGGTDKDKLLIEQMSRLKYDQLKHITDTKILENPTKLREFIDFFKGPRGETAPTPVDKIPVPTAVTDLPGSNPSNADAVAKAAKMMGLDKTNPVDSAPTPPPIPPSANNLPPASDSDKLLGLDKAKPVETTPAPPPQKTGVLESSLLNKKRPDISAVLP